MELFAFFPKSSPCFDSDILSEKGKNFSLTNWGSRKRAQSSADRAAQRNLIIALLVMGQTTHYAPRIRLAAVPF
jgi:hypothetical protein